MTTPKSDKENITPPAWSPISPPTSPQSGSFDSGYFPQSTHPYHKGPLFFDDTYKSSSGVQPGSGPPYIADPIVTNMAMHYGTKLVETGKDMVDKELGKYVAVSKLKFYFSVDTAYVLQKLRILLFPFNHHDWSLKYSQNKPLQPRYDINAPDLYIPSMAYVTYVLVAGLVLGTKDQFSPEMLGKLASQALAWTVVEIVIQLITLYVTNIQCNLNTFDLLAYSGYKFIGIIVSIIFSLLLDKKGYYITLLYTSFALAFFLVRTLKFQVLVEQNPTNLDDSYVGPSKSVYSAGNKRRMYFMLSVAVCQPLLMWWFSYHLVSP